MAKEVFCTMVAKVTCSRASHVHTAEDVFDLLKGLTQATLC